LGAFLSGGIDSSLIVSLMQAQSTIPIKTFTIGFSDKGYNEAEYAKKVAQYLHTDHTELYLSPEQTMSVLQDMPTLYDEPFSDSSQIPTFLISRLARQQVTVSLSGDGSDEIFGGYDRYIWAKSIWQYAGWLKPSAQMIIKKISHMINWDTLDLIFPGKKRSNSIGIAVSGDTVRKFVEFIPFCSQADLYIKLLSHWQHPELLVRGSKEPLLQMIRPSINRTSSSFNNYMMLVDQTYYLPNDILQKVDRASMGVALEVRVPYLDHRIVEFAWHLPLSFKIRDNQTKWILRHVLSKYLPMSLVDRPKQGFALPLGKWLRGPLRDWVEPLLDQSSIRQEGYLNADLIQDVWLEHLSGKRDRQYLIWDILMFEAWLREQRDL
jgi:asparagine synthase (glutamine-hydrolysing)